MRRAIIQAIPHSSEVYWLGPLLPLTTREARDTWPCRRQDPPHGALVEPAKAKMLSGSKKVEPAKTKMLSGSKKAEPAKAKMLSGSKKVEPAKAQMLLSNKKVEPATANMLSDSKRLSQQKQTMSDSKQVQHTRHNSDDSWAVPLLPPNTSEPIDAPPLPPPTMVTVADTFLTDDVGVVGRLAGVNQACHGSAVIRVASLLLNFVNYLTENDSQCRFCEIRLGHPKKNCFFFERQDELH